MNGKKNTKNVKIRFDGDQSILDKYIKIPSFTNLFGRLKEYPNLKTGVSYTLACNHTMIGMLNDRTPQFVGRGLNITVTPEVNEAVTRVLERLEKDYIDEVTTIGSAGGYVGPLGMVSKKKFYSRVSPSYTAVKTPLSESNDYLYSVEGNPVTEQNLKEWFGNDMSKKPSWNGGKIVQIQPKCLAFPYCNQGSVDKPVKLIGETKEHMCEQCYEYVSEVAKETGKKPEYIAKLIREKFIK
jgi:hypothetical protein